jgi:hypothetical protein
MSVTFVRWEEVVNGGTKPLNTHALLFGVPAPNVITFWAAGSLRIRGGSALGTGFDVSWQPHYAGR